MTTERICAFYSHGPHYVRLIRCLRENWPEATLVAAIPADFPFSAIDGLADETIRLPDSEKKSAPRASWAVLRRLRHANCTHMVVMFDSPRLNLLSALSGVKHRRCFTVDGRFYSLNKNPIALLLTALRRRTIGQWHFLCAWWGTRRASQ